MKRIVAAVLFAVLAVSSAGCYGQFALTRKLYTWNGTATGNKYVNSLILFGLIVIPVYEVCTLADWIIFNTVEVFSGSNPMSRLEVPGGHEWVARRIDANQVELARDGVVLLIGTRSGDRIRWDRAIAAR